MEINRTGPGAGGRGLNAGEMGREDAAKEFERIFARQLVAEMTSGLFEEKKNGGVSGMSGGLYREHVVDTLSQELADQELLGMADLVRRYWDGRTEAENPQPESEESEPLRSGDRNE